MKHKEDIALVFAVVLALAALCILSHTIGVNEATLKLEKQAIANGAATYNEKGQLTWIKK
jgi:hypothetical protein